MGWGPFIRAIDILQRPGCAGALAVAANDEPRRTGGVIEIQTDTWWWLRRDFDDTKSPWPRWTANRLSPEPDEWAAFPADALGKEWGLGHLVDALLRVSTGGADVLREHHVESDVQTYGLDWLLQRDGRQTLVELERKAGSGLRRKKSKKTGKKRSQMQSWAEDIRKPMALVASEWGKKDVAKLLDLDRTAQARRVEFMVFAMAGGPGLAGRLVEMSPGPKPARLGRSHYAELSLRLARARALTPAGARKEVDGRRAVVSGGERFVIDKKAKERSYPAKGSPPDGAAEAAYKVNVDADESGHVVLRPSLAFRLNSPGEDDDRKTRAGWKRAKQWSAAFSAWRDRVEGAGFGTELLATPEKHDGRLRSFFKWSLTGSALPLDASLEGHPQLAELLDVMQKNPFVCKAFKDDQDLMVALKYLGR